MKIYTKSGDRGETGLFGGPRVAKDSARIEAYGTVDELNSLIGVARAEPLSADLDDLLVRIQNELFSLGAMLATPDPRTHAVPAIGRPQISALETAIDRLEAELPPLKQFILPGGLRAAALLHVGRTVCRRAERRLVTLIAESGEAIDPSALVYLNRLSDLLFVLARTVNRRGGREDVPWETAE